MLAKLEYLRDRLNTSFWLVPGSMTIAAVAAAPGMLWLDTTPLGAEIGRWTAPSAVGAEGARLVLSTIAGSMITVASLVFSMTLVALTLAASNIGARLLDSYIANRVNQVALGLFLATFVYSLIVLRSISDDEDSAAFVPHFAVSVAMFLAILSFGWLIFFIHELAKSIRSTTWWPALRKISGPRSSECPTRAQRRALAPARTERSGPGCPAGPCRPAAPATSRPSTPEGWSRSPRSMT
jgi:uncharacterized membrane protein